MIDVTDALTVSNLYLQIAGKEILRNISVSVGNGKLIALIGPNGSGKTSLLNCISGLNREFSGTVDLWGDDLNTMTQRKIAMKLAYLHQHMPAQLKLTTRQVIELGLIPRLQPWSGISQQHSQAIDSAINRVSLQPLSNRLFMTLSGGEKQRVLIAKTIVQKPEILLMDEPTNHLDIKHQIDILTLVKSLGLTTITCIHDVNLALAVSDEIVCLNEGKVAFHKTISDITDEDFSQVYDVDCCIDNEPFHNHPRLSIKWG